MKKTKWIAGYPSFLDWYLVPATPENVETFLCEYGDEYESFAEAKKALIETIKQRMDDDRCALKNVRRLTAKTTGGAE